MKNLTYYLSELEVYPTSEEINEASNFAQEKVTDYVHEIDADATVTVEEAEVYVKWSKELELKSEEEFSVNAQSIFDENFSSKLDELQGNNDYKAAIIKIIVSKDFGSGKNQILASRISEAIDWAWSNWDKEIVSTFYEGEKPQFANYEFIENWVVNEDFEEAWATDIQEIKQLFK